MYGDFVVVSGEAVLRAGLDLLVLLFVAVELDLAPGLRELFTEGLEGVL